MDVLASVSLLVFAVGLLSFLWQVLKRVLGDPYEDMPLHSLETPEESLRSARRERIAAEHALWDQEFHAGIHAQRDCTCRENRSSRRAATW